MKKVIAILAVVSLFTLTGCKQVADLVKPAEAEKPVTTPIQEGEKEEDGEGDKEVEEPKTKIVLSKTLNMTNDWTIMGDYSIALTKSGKKDRVILATSARSVNGEMQWDDSQYWTLAVLTEKGAYNLFYQRFQGVVYAEVNEAYIKGIATPIITAYAFSGSDRDIRNYTYSYDEDAFIEDQIFTTKVFSTGGINTLYSTFPEYKAR
ncbi:MAG: hypothetical protein IKR46_04360 [Clostridia bacterium]|nr:hypothetical protein [Clostridia bacterium]